MAELTFSTLFLQLLNSSGMNVSQLFKALKANGVNISYQALAAYKSFDTIPKFEKAKDILDYFGYEIKEQDLKDILDYSRAELKAYREQERKDVRQGIRLNPSFFSDNLTADELDVMIKRRIGELSPNREYSFNSYVSDLIKADLGKHGYIKQDHVDHDFILNNAKKPV